jgi:hypothetical protein
VKIGWRESDGSVRPRYVYEYHSVGASRNPSIGGPFHTDGEAYIAFGKLGPVSEPDVAPEGKNTFIWALGHPVD